MMFTLGEVGGMYQSILQWSWRYSLVKIVSSIHTSNSVPGTVLLYCHTKNFHWRMDFHCIPVVNAYRWWWWYINATPSWQLDGSKWVATPTATICQQWPSRYAEWRRCYSTATKPIVTYRLDGSWWRRGASTGTPTTPTTTAAATRRSPTAQTTRRYNKRFNWLCDTNTPTLPY